MSNLGADNERLRQEQDQRILKSLSDRQNHRVPNPSAGNGDHIETIHHKDYHEETEGGRNDEERR